MTLALLLTAVTGAWAEEKMVTINSSTTSSGAVTATGFNILENFLYVSNKTATITTSEGVITKLVIKKYNGPFGDALTEANVGVTPGTITYGSDEITVTDINAESVTLSRKGTDNWSTSSVDVYYGEPTEWPLTPNAEKKVWTLAKMPASDIELQVEYYPESNIYLSKDAKGVLEVKNEGETLAFDDNGKSTTTVSETNKVTATYNGAKKVIGMTVAKYVPIITWDNTNVFVEANQGKNVDLWNTSATFEGITISFNGGGSASHFYPYDTKGADLDVLDYGDSFTFTAPTGKKFAKIEINGSFSNLNDANWSTQANGIVWSNTPSNTVTIARTESYSTDSDYITSIVFTLSE